MYPKLKIYNIIYYYYSKNDNNSIHDPNLMKQNDYNRFLTSIQVLILLLVHYHVTTQFFGTQLHAAKRARTTTTVARTDNLQQRTLFNTW